MRVFGRKGIQEGGCAVDREAVCEGKGQVGRVSEREDVEEEAFSRRVSEREKCSRAMVLTRESYQDGGRLREKMFNSDIF